MSKDITDGMSIRTAGYPGDLNNGKRMYEGYGILSTVTPSHQTHIQRIDATMINYLIQKGHI